MGHHISKLQHQQLTDEDQPTTSNAPKQQKTLVKSATSLLFATKHSRSKTSKVGKSKRPASTASNTSTSLPLATAKQGSSISSTTVNIPKTSDAKVTTQPESSTGAVVITIRLLKMESSERTSTVDVSSEYSSRMSTRNSDNGPVMCFCGYCEDAEAAKMDARPLTDGRVCDANKSEQTSSTTDEAAPSATLDSATVKVLPAHLIGDVSPYPHHIPFANVLCSADPSIDDNQHDSSYKETTKSKKQNWGLKFNCAKFRGAKTPSASATSSTSSPTAPPPPPTPSSSSSSTSSSASATSVQQPSSPEPSTPTAPDASSSRNSVHLPNERPESSASIYSSTAPSPQSTTLVLDQSTLFSAGGANVLVVTMDQRQPLLELARFSPDEYQLDDCDKQARLQRAIEIDEGVEAPPGFISTSSLQSLHSMSSSNLQLVSNDALLASNKLPNVTLRFMLPTLIHASDSLPRIHSQVDYMHCLVPDLKQITNCSFYWGKMDRYEAERLLENKPEGTFLLRDSAQEEFLFSVSFRKYGRSLHARIEQFNNEFSFDCHDPGVYTSKTVTGLLEHYKDPACVMFFEPALTLPLNRTSVFSLQQLCRATIVSHTTYDGVNELTLPNKLKAYLKEYHYKQRVRLRRYDDTIYGHAS